MREHISFNQSAYRRFAPLHLRAALAASLIWLTPTASQAQMALPTTQPSAGMSATSSLNLGSTRPAGIPLGSTEIVTPGVSPINPSPGVTNCAVSDNSGSSGTLFDGGGLSGGSSLGCSSSTTITPIVPAPLSTVGRVGIPLGATEIGGAGISPAVPVPGPMLSSGTSSIDGSTNP
jgi:hypothetical protein